MDEIELDFDPNLNALLIRFKDLIATRDMMKNSELFSSNIRDMLVDNVQKEIDRIVSDLEAAGDYMNV